MDLCARSVLSLCFGVVKPVVNEPIPTIEDDSASIYSHHSVSSSEHDIIHPQPTEQTPLVSKPASIASTRSSPCQKRSILRFVSPLAVAALAGLLVGLVPGIKHRVADEGSSFWQTFGVALISLGMAFPVVEMLGIGAGLRAGGKNL
jgi:hypothetical protein